MLLRGGSRALANGRAGSLGTLLNVFIDCACSRARERARAFFLWREDTRPKP